MWKDIRRLINFLVKVLEIMMYIALGLSLPVLIYITLMIL